MKPPACLGVRCFLTTCISGPSLAEDQQGGPRRILDGPAEGDKIEKGALRGNPPAEGGRWAHGPAQGGNLPPTTKSRVRESDNGKNGAEKTLTTRANQLRANERNALFSRCNHLTGQKVEE